MKYKTLFSISLFHAYFQVDKEDAGRTPELDRYLTLVPSGECAQMIKRYRLMLRNKPGRLLLASPEHAEGTFLPKAELSFRFFLRIKDAAFLQFTDLGNPPFDNMKDIFAGLRFPRYVADGSREDLAPERYEDYKANDHFQIREEKSGRDVFFLKSRPLSGLNRDDFSIHGLKGEAFRPVKYDPELKTIQFSTTAYEAGQSFWATYRSVPPWAPDTFGIVDIHVDGNAPDLEQNYRIAFESRKTFWNYFIVSPATLTPEDLTIENGANGSDELTFGQAAEISEGEIFDRLKAAFGKAKVFKVSSAGEIPYHHKTKTGIKLKKKDEVIIPHLPNPSPAKNGIEIINIYS